MTLRALLIPALLITVALYLGTFHPGSTFHSAGYILILRWAMFLTAVIGAINAGTSRLQWAMVAFVAVQILFNPFWVIRLRDRHTARVAQHVGVGLMAIAGARVLFAKE